MEIIQIIILALLAIVLAEVTYMLTRLPRAALKTKRRAVLVDTSVIMDGRIVSIAKTGFIGDTLVIPRSVVGELQYLADHADSDKRERARHGLDTVSELQAMPQVDVELLQDSTSASEGVDNRLLALAKQHDALICTIDYNLNKVATVEGIQVLNVNDLAQGIRMSHLPGETVQLEMVQKGQDSHQGVGYLPDGTMVVVEQASGMIGKSIPVEIIRSLQTSAGKMMFAKRIQTQPVKTEPPRPASKPSRPTRPQASGTKPAKKDGEQSTNTPRRTKINQSASQQSTARVSSDASSKPAVRTDTAKPAAKTPARRRRKDHEARLVSMIDNQ